MVTELDQLRADRARDVAEVARLNAVISVQAAASSGGTGPTAAAANADAAATIASLNVQLVAARTEADAHRITVQQCTADNLSLMNKIKQYESDLAFAESMKAAAIEKFTAECIKNNNMETELAIL